MEILVHVKEEREESRSRGRGEREARMYSELEIIFDLIS